MIYQGIDTIALHGNVPKKMFLEHFCTFFVPGNKKRNRIVFGCIFVLFLFFCSWNKIGAKKRNTKKLFLEKRNTSSKPKRNASLLFSSFFFFFFLWPVVSLDHGQQPAVEGR